MTFLVTNPSFYSSFLGVIAVFDVGTALNDASRGDTPTVSGILPTHYMTAHQSAIRSLAWIKTPPCDPIGRPILDQNPTTIISGGYDGQETLLDVRMGHAVSMNRTRGLLFSFIRTYLTLTLDVVTSVAYSPYTGGPIAIDRDNTVKEYSISPSLLGRGHLICDLQAPAWVCVRLEADLISFQTVLFYI